MGIRQLVYGNLFEARRASIAAPRSWSNCPDWPWAHACKQKICNIGFAVHCNYEVELWKCKMCFSDRGETSLTHDALAKHCCEAKRKAEGVWVSIGSAFCLLLLLALGCCMFNQTRYKRRIRDRLRDRELGATCRPRVGKANGTARLTTPCRRVPVLPVSASNAAAPNAIQARQGSGDSSGRTWH